MHDLTAARIEGIDTPLDAYPDVEILIDAGYQGLARDHRDQVSAPPLKLQTGASPQRQAVTPTPVLAADPGRARHRRTEKVARPATLHRLPRTPTRDHQRHRRPRLVEHATPPTLNYFAQDR
jgi:hypothetical protein